MISKPYVFFIIICYDFVNYYKIWLDNNQYLSGVLVSIKKSHYDIAHL